LRRGPVSQPQRAPETGADTSFLVEAGVPGFSLVPEPLHYFDFHHTPADTLDKIVPKELAENAAIVTVWAYAMANSEQALPREVKSDK